MFILFLSILVILTSFGSHPEAQLSIIPLLVGAALGAGKFAAAKSRANKDRELAAEQIRLSPYTERTTFQSINDPSLMEDLAGGMGAGINAGQSLGVFKKSPTDDVDDVIDTDNTVDGYSPTTTYAGSAPGPYAPSYAGGTPGPWAPKMTTMQAGTNPGANIGGGGYTSPQFMMTNLQRQKARRDENMFG